MANKKSAPKPEPVEDDEPKTKTQQIFEKVYGEHEGSRESDYVTIRDLKKLFTIAAGEETEPEESDDDEAEAQQS